MVASLDVQPHENGAAEAAKYVNSIVQQAEKISSEPNNKGDEHS